MIFSTTGKPIFCAAAAASLALVASRASVTDTPASWSSCFDSTSVRSVRPSARARAVGSLMRLSPGC